MDVQVWSKTQDKRAQVLALRLLLARTGNVFTLKKKRRNAVEAVRRGGTPRSRSPGW